MMPHIFISYRRSDTQGVAGRIYDRLAQAFGKERLFMDVDDIPPGGDFRTILSDAIAQADVVLLLIGPQWHSLMRRRRNSEHDFVRIEMLEAIAQRKITIPVLLNTPMPDTNCLPARLRPVFPYLNAVDVDMGANFHRDMTRLIGQLEAWEEMPLPPELPEEPGRPQWIDRLITNVTLILTIALGALLGVGSYTAYLRIAQSGSSMVSASDIPQIPAEPAATDIAAYILSHADEPGAPVLAEVNGHEQTFLQLRLHPDSESEIFKTIRAGTLIVVEGRTWDGQWLSTTIDRQRVWFKAPFVRLMRDGEMISIVDVPLDGRDVGSAIDVLAAYDDGSRFRDALRAAGLDDALAADDPVTVFIPPNAMFDALLVDEGITLQDSDALRELLSPYILEGQFDSAALIAQSQAQYAPDGRVQVNGTAIAIPDVTVGNGVLHVLEDVFQRDH